MIKNALNQRVSSLAGVGEKTSQALAKLGILSLFDLLMRVPKALVEEIDCPGFAHMEAGRTYVAKGTVSAHKISGFANKQRLEVILEDDSGRMLVIFFGPAVRYAQNILKTGVNITIIGEAKEFLGRMQMVHPKLITEDKGEITASAQASYSQTAGISPALFKRLVHKALAILSPQNLVEHLTKTQLSSLKFSPLLEAIEQIHTPNKSAELSWDLRGESRHFRRLAFEELLSFYLRMFLHRQGQTNDNGYSIAINKLSLLTKDFLPFSLTGAQARVCNEIIRDLSQKKPMTRLVQGDVGSGKTAVSAIAALHCVNSSLQVGVMAPTEILAEQLARVYKDFFRNKNINIALVTGSTKISDRREIAKKIAAGQINILIGTHALLSPDICFKNLGLLVIDEQHRFGVNQRATLIAQCEATQGFAPHLLVMSATPIPRSLALTLYGDLDLSVIDERPPGRIAIQTKILQGVVLHSLATLCARIVATKQKAFIVFPLIEESETLDLQNASKAFKLIGEQFGINSCGLLHGKMKAADKAQVMDDFKHSKISLLISTTVVEVGVDIPDATCMVIVHPERFGLAQLHQLRGRVGRKDLASFCFLLTDITNKFGTAYKRLSALCKTENGFELAEVDLKLRGPGELLGTRQAGQPNFLVFNHTDFANIVEPAKSYAKDLCKNKLNQSHTHLFIDKEAYFS